MAVKQITLDYKGVDFWSRPIFKVLEFKSVYVCSVDTLFDNSDPPKKVINHFKKNKSELVIFGSNLDDDPLGDPIKSSLKIRFKKHE